MKCNTKKIVLSTTFREFDGTVNDRMQFAFLRSLKRQTFQNYTLVVTIFGEKNVERIVRKVLKNKCCFVYDSMDGNYKFSLSKTFINGVNYGLMSGADILMDCSSDIILQNNFLETVALRNPVKGAGICHPNIFRIDRGNGCIKYMLGSIIKGIDVRFFSLEIFKEKKIYQLLIDYPSYDYGAGIETFLCGIAIKYAKERVNIFMESKVIKEENDRDVKGRKSAFVKDGFARNYPVVKKFLRKEKLGENLIGLNYVNAYYKVTKAKWIYKIMKTVLLIKYGIAEKKGLNL